MVKRRTVTIKNIYKVPLEERPLRRLVYRFYKGPRDVLINFDNRITSWGQHWYNKTTKTHEISLSSIYCSHEKEQFMDWDFHRLTADTNLEILSNRDTASKLIFTLLHELKHAMQCDDIPSEYNNSAEAFENIYIQNKYLRYWLAPLEAEAEGWALLNFKKALDFYLCLTKDD